MALLLAVLRTLVDERLEPKPLIQRLNAQIVRHSPSSRFITLFYAVYTPATGSLAYVNAGQNPPLIRRRDGRYERLTATGVALGMSDRAAYDMLETQIDPGEMLIMYSDGITETEDPAGAPLEEPGLQEVIERHLRDNPAELSKHIISEVEAFAQAPRFADDLTILILKRADITGFGVPDDQFPG
jgi:sigma-B regulation protein RsbU (phosphoserine phosphatase)